MTTVLRDSLNRSNLLRWGYRLALIAAAFGFLASLNIAYVDMVDGEMDRAASGAALGLSSVVLAVSVVLGRKLRRRSKDLAHRLEKLEKADHVLMESIQSLPKTLRHTILKETESKLRAVFGELQAELPRQRELVVDAQKKIESQQAHIGQMSDEHASLMQRAVQLLGSALSLNGDLSTRGALLGAYGELIAALREHGQNDMADQLVVRVTEMQAQIQSEFREQFVSALEQQQWLVALETGEQIQQLFPDSAMAREFLQLQPRIAQKIQQQIDSRRSDRDSSSSPSEEQASPAREWGTAEGSERIKLH